MGTVFVVVAGRHGTHAESFYRMFPAESVLPDQQVLSIDRVERVSSPSLDTLLRAVATRQDREIVVVTHGNPTQLALPVMAGIDVGVDLDFVNAVLGASSDADLARRLGTRERNTERLRSRIEAVQRLRLTRLELRACRVGESRPMLEALGRLFGASTTCAPRVFDGYGTIRGTRPTTDAGALSRWQSGHPGHQTHGTAPNRFFWVNDGSVDPPVISAAFAESWAGVRAWAEAKFPSGPNHRFRQGTFHYHIQTRMLPTSSTVHGQRTFDSSFAFPKDSSYRANLVRVTGSSGTRPAETPPGSAPQGRAPLGLDTRYAARAPADVAARLSPRGPYRVPGPLGVAART